MKNKMVCCSKRYFSLFLSIILVFCLIGCSPSNDQPDITDTEIQPSPDSEEAVSDVEFSGKIDDNGKPIYDFDEFVNGEWRSQYEGSDSSVRSNNEIYDLYLDRMRDIVENTDLSELDKESGLYKAISLYNELSDTSDAPQRMKHIKDYLQSIEKIATLTGLAYFYSQDKYVNNEYVFWFSVKPDEFGYNRLFYNPGNLTSDVNAFKERISQSDNETADFYRQCFDELGYSEERLNELFDNCLKIGSYIDTYYENGDDYLEWWDSEKLTDAQVAFPVFDIINCQTNLSNEVYFYADDSFPEFINEVFVQENLQALKDCMIFGSLWLLKYSGYDQYLGYDIPEFEDGALRLLLLTAPDVMAREYMKRYSDDEVINDINSLILDVKKAELSIVSDCEWLSDESKEAVKQKMSRMTQYIGENGHKYLLNDYEMCGYTIYDILEINALYYNSVREQVYYEDSSRAPFGNEISDVNARFNRMYNSFIIYPAYVCDPLFTDADTYEERLAFLGDIIAHEIGHSIDRAGINYDWEGYWGLTLTDAEIEAYNSVVGAVSDYLSGMNCEFDTPIPGDIKVDETIADLIAMETCLRILAEREDVDYDLFFRTYAENYAAYYTEDDFDYYLNDEHLTAKPRINCILAQFDEFYETYEIDESSPYYVPEDQRLRIF